MALDRADDPTPEPRHPVRRGSSAANLRALRRAVKQHQRRALVGHTPKIEGMKPPPMAMPTNVEPIRLPDPDWQLAAETDQLLGELLIAAEEAAAEARRSRRVALGVGITMPIFTLSLTHLIR